VFTGIIFDFDGTLVRSHGQVYDVMKRLTAKSCPNMPSPEVMRELSTREMMATLGVKTWQIPWFTHRARRLLRERVDEIEFEPGLIEILRAAKRARLSLGLVSSNSRHNVIKILRRHDVADLFDQMHFGSALLGKRKALIKVAARLNRPPAELLCVGDETRDIDAAREAGLRSLAVGWGFHSLGKQRTHGPDLTAATPAELRTVLGLL
jgi:phosphoglycolate phosphatase